MLKEIADEVRSGIDRQGATMLARWAVKKVAEPMAPYIKDIKKATDRYRREPNKECMLAEYNNARSAFIDTFMKLVREVLDAEEADDEEWERFGM